MEQASLVVAREDATLGASSATQLPKPAVGWLTQRVSRPLVAPRVRKESHLESRIRMILLSGRCSFPVQALGLRLGFSPADVVSWHCDTRGRQDWYITLN